MPEEPFQDIVDILVVITCYHATDLTIQCLRSLQTEVRSVPGLKAAVCENGSGGDSAARLNAAIATEGWKEWAYVKQIYPNCGFTGGSNAILRDALGWPNPPKLFLLLNADTIVQSGAVRALRTLIEERPDLGIVAPKLVSSEGEVQTSCFRDPSPLSEFLRAARTRSLNRLCGRGPFALAPKTDARNYDWVSFACALIRREVFEQVGLLDEGYYLYFDDPDYCRRGRQAGWSVVYCPEAHVIHLVGQSNPVESLTTKRRRRPRYYYVSRARYYAKFYGSFGLWLANGLWSAGRMISLPRELLGQKQPHLCEKEWRDIWTNWRSPLMLPTVTKRTRGKRSE